MVARLLEYHVLGMAHDLAQAPTDGTFGPLPAIVMVAFIVGFAVFMTFSIRGKIARRNAERPTARELVEQIKNHPRVVAGEAQGLAAELHHTAQRLGAQLDNKARRLEKLIEDADLRIAALGIEQPAMANAAPVAPAAPIAPAQSNGGRQTDALTQEVYEQADAGRTAVEIAQQLDEQVGKIEVILALRAS